jgi:hypothetical protein
MACHELPSAVEDHVAVDDVRRRAGRLSAAMTGWLSASVLDFTPLYPENGDAISADLEQWCRSARDVLEELARG